jgi:hypothetical protein
MYFFGYGKLRSAMDTGQYIQLVIEQLPNPGFVWPAEGDVRWSCLSDLASVQELIWTFAGLSAVVYFDRTLASAAQALAREVAELESKERSMRLAELLLKYEHENRGVIV